MQYYLNGFLPGDPTVQPESSDPKASDVVDVLIVGTGPAGLVLAAQLARFAGVSTAIIDRAPGPLTLGRADGIACRTVEMFEAFGRSDALTREGYWVNETTFWAPDEKSGKLTRNSRVQDTEDGLSEFPHLIINQARIHSHLLDLMMAAPARLAPRYNTELAMLIRHETGSHPVEALVRTTDEDGVAVGSSIRARYVVGCDGARSTVRKSIGLALAGESASQVWGVMDVLAVTDFPDVRYKSVIHSASEGSILLIPREGGYMFRTYIEMEALKDGERVADRDITLEQLVSTAQRILAPYTLDVKETVWWSAYEVGQRLTPRFDDGNEHREPRIFIAGDACHTHSPKAGQGMNVSMQDAFNLAWKLGAVIEGRSPENLLRTYSEERQGIAQGLIDFDKDWARLMAAPPKDPSDPNSTGIDPEEVSDYFAKSGRYTAGVATRYSQAPLTASDQFQHLAVGFTIGERFHSAPVVRVADARQMQLGHVADADGRWRIYVFADSKSPNDPQSRARLFCDSLAAEHSIMSRAVVAGADPDAVLDVRAVYQSDHRAFDLSDVPDLLKPAKGRYGLIDYEKVFAARITRGDDIFSIRGVDRNMGCAIVVRPDQYVAAVIPLDRFDMLESYFAPILLTR